MFSGAAHSIARVWLLEGDALAAGQQGWAQLQLTTPMALANGDRFIVRLPSPSITLGGGVVIDAHPAVRYRRRHAQADTAVLSRLQALSQGTPEERLLNALGELRFTTADEAMRKAQLAAQQMTEAFATLTTSGAAAVSQGVIALRETWHETQTEAAKILAAFHASQPLLEGMPRDTLRSRLKLTVDVDEGDVVHLQSHAVRFTPEQQRAVDALMAQCRAQPWATPSVKDVHAAIGDGIFDVLLRRKQLVQLSPDVIVLPEVYEQAVRDVRSFIQREGQMTAAQVRDLFGTTRKYALALMEHLDAIGITKRVGDARVLR